jgi:hypothetical protein
MVSGVRWKKVQNPVILRDGKTNRIQSVALEAIVHDNDNLYDIL